MSAAASLCLLLLFLRSSAAGAELPPPQNVDLITLNTQYTLTWDWDQSATESHAVTFTTQCVSMYQLESRNPKPKWCTACDERPDRSCDLAKCKLHYLGIYMLRVRASSNGRHSLWVQREFQPDKDAAVGPPSTVRLGPADSGLDIFITDPLTSTNSSMKEHLPDLYYHVVYWEQSAGWKASTTQTLTVHTNVVTVSSLKSWTWYCVSIQTRYDYYNKTSSFTTPHCMQTEGVTAWWQICLYFLGSLLLFFVLFLATLSGFYWFWKKVKETLYPPNQLPPHFKEYLCDSPGSDLPRLLTPDSESELLCDNVVVCPEPAILEIHQPPPEDRLAPPSGLEPDSSGRHSRQDSGSSGDSGVYSTGGSSNQRQPNSGRVFVGVENCGKFPVDQVKMQEMAPELKSGGPAMADEGIVDVCV